MWGRRQIGIYVLISVVVTALSQCANFNQKQDLRGPSYAARTSCVECHKDLTESFANSSHFHTSAEIRGDDVGLQGHGNTFPFSQDLNVKVEPRAGGLYQVTYKNGLEVRAEKADIAFGSGEKATTFGYWSENGLSQLPLTYYREIDSYVNSPGFPSDHPDYGRAIVSRCLECHSSFAASKIIQTSSLSVSEEVVKGSILYGIDCQRCHGPAGKHVTFHQENPKETEARFITRIGGLSRQQKVDMCAVCHSGNDKLTQRSTFSFTPGDTLSKFYYPQYSRSTKEPDVHGNQYQMLASSSCFINSDMDCSSCHSPHVNEKKNPVLFSQRCQSCHSVQNHSEIGVSSAVLEKNCIDCHMPLKPSKLITFQEAGKSAKMPYMLRSHKIAIYPGTVPKSK